MLKVAITGNIAAGKSTVEKVIEKNGYRVYDTDIIAHKIIESNNDIKKIFGTTDRKKLAEIVFSDSEKLRLLESIIHPAVKKELEKIFSSDENIIFVSVPQLFEAGFETLFNKIIYITADENIRLERLIKRNSYTIQEAKKRINAQSENNKKENSHYIIENNTSFEDLEKQVSNILEKILYQ